MDNKERKEDLIIFSILLYIINALLMYQDRRISTWVIINEYQVHKVKQGLFRRNVNIFMCKKVLDLQEINDSQEILGSNI